MALMLVLGFLLLCAAARAAEEPGDDETPENNTPAAKQDLPTQSLGLRTALHNDPALEAPFDRLLSLYSQTNQTDALVTLYRNHVAQYPADANGITVLVRLLMATRHADALKTARAAAEKFPKDGYLRYLLFKAMRANGELKSLDELDRAVELETRAHRKLAWVDELLPIATVEDRRDLAQKHLAALAKLVVAPEGRLEVARKMIKFKFHEAALELIDQKDAAAPPPETMVALEMEAATAEIGLDRMEAAGTRLDRLLGKLTADYWQRPEIVRRRLALVKTQAERDRMIAAARQRVTDHPRDESAALDLTQILTGLDLPREALAALGEAGKRLPKSAEIEKRTLDLLDGLHDDRAREEYLAGRLKEFPDRKDLLLLRVKTLYALGRRADAAKELTAAVDPLPAADRRNQLLEMARHLRKASMAGEAAALYRRVLELDPARLDVRRELAETFLSLGQRHKLGELFREVAKQPAELENLLDLVQFMLQQGLLVEAKAALAPRLEQEKENLDLRLLVLKVEQRLGNAAGGTALIDKCRALCDTGARYRMWLEAAVAFHQEFDDAEKFLRAELDRLDREPAEWTPRRLERRVALAELAARNGCRNEARTMLENDLAGNVPPAMRAQLRRQLVSVLESDFTRKAGVAQQLEELAKEDPAMADECQARLALLYARDQRRQHLVPAILAKIDVTRISEPALLGALRGLPQATGYNDPKLTLALIERITILNPTDRSAWEQWMIALATNGDEERLSIVVRRLLAGVDKMPIAESTRTLLETHLTDSCWRSVCRRLVEGKDAALADALPLLQSAERLSRDDAQRLWIAWVRAYILGRLDRRPARDEAIKELETLAARLRDPKDAAAGKAPLMIGFPDGLSMSLPQARKLLSAGSAPAALPVPGSRQGPLPPFGLRWTFETDGRAMVASIIPLDEKRVLVGDQRGTAYGVDAATGKLLWQQDGILQPVPPRLVRGDRYDRYSSPSSWGGRYYGESDDGRPPPSAAPLLADGNGRFYVSKAGDVACHAADNGRLLWRAELGATDTIKTKSANRAWPPPPGSGSPPPAPVSIFFYGAHLIVYEPASGAVVKLDRDSGKVVWQRTFGWQEQAGAAQAMPQPGMLGPHNSGASLAGRRLLVYGPRTAIVDLENGEVEWSFEPWRVRRLPVKLVEPVIANLDVPFVAAPSAYPPSYPSYGIASRSYGASRYYPPSAGYAPSYATYGTQSVYYLDYLALHGGGLPTVDVCLISPAVQWAAQVNNVRQAWLLDNWLLLGSGGANMNLNVMRTDLPLKGVQISLPGQFLGVSGRTLCAIQPLYPNGRYQPGGTLAMTDLPDGSQRSFQLNDLAGPGGAPMQAAIDGPAVYVSGPQGILCVNARTAQRLFFAPWPKSIAPKKPRKPPAAAQPEEVIVLEEDEDSGLTISSAPMPYIPGAIYGLPGDDATLPPVIMPMVARVDRGVLYTVIKPDEVVALVPGLAPKAEKEKESDAADPPDAKEGDADAP